MEAEAPRRHLAALAAAACAYLAACAVPVPPSGGPPDERPPQVIETRPADGAVGVRPDRVEIRFDEFLDMRSASGAVSVTPEPALPPEIRPGGRAIEIIFRSPLRDSTTYIISVDTALRDAHGVALNAPVRVAFSTGDRINQGRLSGRVLRAETGEPDPGLDIYAWLRPGGDAPEQLPSSPPDYRTQTDERGAFSFSYLQEAPYFVIGLRDANRNRTADPGEAIALPPLPAVTARPDSAQIQPVWLSARIDTTAPRIRRVLPISESRVAIEFDSDVRLLARTPADWQVTDTLSAAATEVQDVYQPVGEPRRIVLTTPRLAPQTWLIQVPPGTVADSTGNQARPTTARFSAPARPDTLQLRFLGFSADSLTVQGGIRFLPPDTPPALLFSHPPSPEALQAGLVVADTAGTPLPWTAQSLPGTRVEVLVAGDAPFDLLVDLGAFSGPDSTASLRVQPLPARQRGEIAGIVRPAGPRIVVSGFSEGRLIRQARADSTGRFVLSSLPGEMILSIRALADADSSGTWSYGSLDPFRPAERLAWLEESPPVRARWETVIPDTLRLIDPVPTDTLRRP